jgi:hypothetical protein
MTDLIDFYFRIKANVFEYFGYKENWRVLPLDDAREYYWKISDYGDSVLYADRRQDLGEGDGYEAEIYKQRFLEKWVYPADDYTMILVDTHVDLNQLLMVFDNKKEVCGE